MDWATTLIILILAIPLAIVLGVVTIAIVAILRGGKSDNARRLDAEEAKTMQQIYQGLEKMEKRVEALETLLLEREGKDDQ